MLQQQRLVYLYTSHISSFSRSLHADSYQPLITVIQFVVFEQTVLIFNRLCRSFAVSLIYCYLFYDIRHTRINLLDSKSNYSTTSNDTELVHWPLMGGLLHLALLLTGLGLICPLAVFVSNAITTSPLYTLVSVASPKAQFLALYSLSCTQPRSVL